MKIIMKMNNNFKTVPEGRRRFKITKSECSPSGSPKRWNLTYEDVAGEGNILNRFDFTNDKSKFAMAKFLEVMLDFKDGDEFDTTEDAKRCLGLEFYADVKHTQGNQVDDDGNPRIFANIDNKTIEKATDEVKEESPRNSIASAIDGLD